MNVFAQICVNILIKRAVSDNSVVEASPSATSRTYTPPQIDRYLYANYKLSASITLETHQLPLEANQGDKDKPKPPQKPPETKPETNKPKPKRQGGREPQEPHQPNQR